MEREQIIDTLQLLTDSIQRLTKDEVYMMLTVGNDEPIISLNILNGEEGLEVSLSEHAVSKEDIKAGTKRLENKYL